jgi:hypothetical protein
MPPGLVLAAPESSPRFRPSNGGSFTKSMISYGDHRQWRDVYHVPSEAGLLYVKSTADVVADLLLLSFKEKDNG